MRALLLISALVFMAACSSSGQRAPTTAAAQIDPFALQASSERRVSENYRIGPTDLLKMTVFQVKDLSADELRVDSSGNVEVPLIGT
ncbi:MAG: polysaccharide export protein, partial [Verrucomicrobiaceae bacterium]